MPIAKDDSLLVHAHCVSTHCVLWGTSDEKVDVQVRVWQAVALAKLLQTDTCTGDFQRIDSALVVSELVQSRAGLVGAVKAVLVFDAANSS